MSKEAPPALSTRKLLAPLFASDRTDATRFLDDAPQPKSRLLIWRDTALEERLVLATGMHAREPAAESQTVPISEPPAAAPASGASIPSRSLGEWEVAFSDPAATASVEEAVPERRPEPPVDDTARWAWEPVDQGRPAVPESEPPADPAAPPPPPSGS